MGRQTGQRRLAFRQSESDSVDRARGAPAVRKLAASSQELDRPPNWTPQKYASCKRHPDARPGLIIEVAGFAGVDRPGYGARAK